MEASGNNRSPDKRSHDRSDIIAGLRLDELAILAAHFEGIGKNEIAQTYKDELERRDRLHESNEEQSA